jgi:hydroxyacylglutathione hydrolase
MKQEAPRLKSLQPGLSLIAAPRPNSHSYLIRGGRRNALIDTGLPVNLPHLLTCLGEVGLGVQDIHLIVLTHEHLDHMGAAAHFAGSALIAAHRLAAHKISIGDEFVLSNKYFDQPARAFTPDLWLEEGTQIDLGDFRLQVIHTPGHCSGCQCLYEPDRRLLFTGDTLLAGGIFSGVLTSGNIGDQIQSLRRLQTLKVDTLLPGHGPLSNSPEEDIRKAIEASLDLLEDTRMLFDTLNTRHSFERLLGSARNRPRLNRAEHQEEVSK